MAQLRLAKSRFDDAGAQVVLVGMGSVPETAAFKHKMDISFPMISDPERNLYEAFHLGFMSVGSIFTPKMVVRAATALVQGHGVGFPHGDVRQLSGVFIIETDGTISYSHFAKDSADHPEPEALLDRLS